MPDGILVVVEDRNRSQLRVAAEQLQRAWIFLGNPFRDSVSANGQCHSPGPFDRIGQQLVVNRIAAGLKRYVEEDALRAGSGQAVDHSGMITPRPGPPADVTKRLIVDGYKYDIPACGVAMEVVACNAQRILDRPA